MIFFFVFKYVNNVNSGEIFFRIFLAFNFLNAWASFTWKLSKRNDSNTINVSNNDPGDIRHLNGVMAVFLVNIVKLFDDDGYEDGKLNDQMNTQTINVWFDCDMICSFDWNDHFIYKFVVNHKSITFHCKIIHTIRIESVVEKKVVII